MKKKPVRIVVGEGHVPLNQEFRFYCGLPVWEHNVRNVSMFDFEKQVSRKKVRLVIEVLE